MMDKRITYHLNSVINYINNVADDKQAHISYRIDNLHKLELEIECLLDLIKIVKNDVEGEG